MVHKKRGYGEKNIKVTGLSLHARLTDVIKNGKWFWPSARSDELVEIQGAICGTMIPDTLNWNRAVWELTPDGNLSTRSGWDHLRRKDAQIEWHKLVWGSPNIPRDGFIVWLAVYNRFSRRVMQVLMGRGIDADCLLCGSADEDRDHLFFPNLIPLRYGK
jgi:hypothetical protein